MFASLGRAVVRGRWAVLVAGLLLALVGATWGTGVFARMSAGGFDDPGSESVRTAERIVAETGRQDFDLVVLYSSKTATVDDPSFRAAVASTLATVAGLPQVEAVASYLTVEGPTFVSADRHTTYAAIRLRHAESITAFGQIRRYLAAPGLSTEIGGPTAVYSDAEDQVKADITKAEIYSMPVLLILLVLVFGSAVAATVPLLIGGLAILGAFVATRALTSFTDVSVFAINIITLVGLGLAVDYGLFMVSRFREELARGLDVEQAVCRTVATAGRTVAVSALTVALALASLLLFPQAFLRSMGLGGMAAVLVDMVASLTVLPAMLAVLGTRINAVPIRLPRRSAWLTRRLPWRRAGCPGDGAWARIAYAVMRRPVPVAVGVLIVLGVLAVPFSQAKFGSADHRILPAGAESRIVAERLEREFPGQSNEPIDVLITGADQQATMAFVGAIEHLPGVVRSVVSANRGTSSVIMVYHAGGSADRVARDLVTTIRDQPVPNGATVLVGGRAALLVDLLDSLANRLPIMALLVAVTTMVLLFLAFGSILLPIKAVLMNVLSLGASFGAMVWAYQEGHLAGLFGFASTGDIEASELILMLAVLFGLATDYEVFLLSRVREEWDATGDNTAAVAGGLQRTGRIITSAAVLLMVVVAGFTTGGITYIKMIGIGMLVAIAVDATIVRILLVPATMRLLGRANWWLPGPLARLYRRIGLHEEPVGTPEASSDRMGGWLCAK